MRVRVYRNLKHGRNTQPLYSIQHKGRVIDRRHQVLLCDVSFVVSKAGRKRCIREGVKNVHAYAEGLLVDEHGAFGIDADGRNLPMRVSYNPYRSASFEAEGYPVTHARAVLLNESGMTACYLD